MSLDRFIFCPCTHSLDVHGEGGCAACACARIGREVIDGLLDFERDAIHRTWLSSASESSAQRFAPRAER